MVNAGENTGGRSIAERVSRLETLGEQMRKEMDAVRQLVDEIGESFTKDITIRADRNVRIMFFVNALIGVVGSIISAVVIVKILN